MSLLYRQFAFGLFYLTLVMYCTNGHAREFETEGVMNIIPLVHGIKPFSCQMRVYYRDCQWKIEQIWENPTNRIIEEMVDDGTNLYVLDHSEVPAPNAASSNGWRALTNSWIGQIHRHGYPERSYSPEKEMLFYGFASSCYLDSITNGLVDPIKFEPDQLRDGDQRVSANVTRNRDNFMLPAKVYFLGEQNRTNAFLNASTNIYMKGGAIPQTLELTRYIEEGKPLIIYRFVVAKAVEQCPVESFTPKLSEYTLISDYRFSHGKAYVPPVSCGFLKEWPTEAQDKLRPGYRVTQMDFEKIQATATMQRLETSQAGRHPWVRTIFICFAGASTIGLFAIVFRNRKPNSK
jgi:hypothetical protein